MKHPRPKLYLVGDDPAEIFDDLDGLRRDLASPPTGRTRSAVLFARIPHDKALALYRHKLGAAEWAVLIELDRLNLKRRGQNPLKLVSARLRNAGVAHYARSRALRRLEAAGVIRVEQRGVGRAPWVTHLWFPLRE